MSNYPQNIDTDAELPPVQDNITEIGGEAINSLREAVFALEKALGTNPQGSLSNVSDRLSAALNDDGTFKAAALSSAGLVSLPITNAQIGATAGIEESKLDLDVETLDLQNQITSNDLDITSLQNSLSNVLNDLTQHINGIALRHDGYEVDLSGGLSGATSISTVGEALHFVRNTFLSHKAATAEGEHFASAITYEPQSESIITTTNVQDAITSIEDDFIEDRRKHNDAAHSDGVSKDGYVLFGGQAVVNDGSLKLVRYGGSSGDTQQVGVVNSASVKSRNLSLSDISSSANSIDVDVSIGTGITRSLSITNLDTAEYPSGSGRLNLPALIDAFNLAFSNAQFPVSAFPTDDGELVLQHNIARDNCTITISSPGGASAVSALGFGDVDGQEIPRIENYRFVVNGTPYTELKTISSGDLTQGSLSSVVDLGVDVSSSGLDLYEPLLFHVFDHTTDAANGTYLINTIAPSGSTTIGLSSTLAAGSFSYIIYEDVVEIPVSANSRTFDFYIDDSRNLIASNRMEVTSVQISGMRVVEVSQDFPAATGASISLTKSGTTYSLSITLGGNTGETTTFTGGFLGYVKVFAPDNKSFIRIFVFDTSPPAPRTDTVSFTATEFQDNRLLLGVNHLNSGTGLEFPLDRRNVGLVGNTSVGSEFFRDVLSRDLANLHASGIVRGFDIVSSTSTSVEINGGFAYIDGRAVCKERQTINFTNTASSDGDWNLFLNSDGNYEIFEEGTAGKSVQDALATDEFIILSQINVFSGSVNTLTDARFFINDIETRLQLTVDSRELGAGSFRTLEAAVLYSESAPNDTKPEITILSDLSFSSAQTINTGSRIVSFGDLTFSAALSLSANSVLEVFGTFTSSSTITLSDGASILLHGSASGGDYTLDGYGTLLFGDDSEVDGITVNGDNAAVIGEGALPTILFPGNDTGLVVSSGVDDLRVENLNFVMPRSTFDLVEIADGYGFSFEKCRFVQSPELLIATELGQVSRGGIHITGAGTTGELIIDQCEFDNLGSGINQDASNGLLHLDVRNCRFDRVGESIRTAGNLVASRIRHNVFVNNHNKCISFAGPADSVRRVLIEGNTFDGIENASQSRPEVIFASNDVEEVLVVGNTIRDITANQSLVSLSGDGIVVSNNQVVDCDMTTTNIYALEITNNSVGSVEGNTIRGHAGHSLSVQSRAVIGNSVVVNSSLSGDNIVLDNANDYCVVSGNQFNVNTTDEVIRATNVIFTGNEVLAGSIVLEADSASFLPIVSGNVLVNTDTTATSGISFTNSANVQAVFSDNVVSGGGTTNVVSIESGKFVVSNNNIVRSSGTTVLRVGDGTNSSVESYVISNNQIEASSANFGIFVNGYNALVEGNYIRGALAAGSSNGDIVADSTAQNLYISGNFAGGSSGGSARVFHQSASPTNVFIRNNKGATEEWVYSPYSAFESGTWSGTLSGFNSSTSGDQIYIALDGLPVGAELESVDVHFNNGGGLGDAEVRIFRRRSSSLTADAITATDPDPLPAGFNTYTVAVSGTEYILEGREYFVRIELTAAVSVSVGQVVANIRV